jgi:hypothetical protein
VAPGYLTSAEPSRLSAYMREAEAEKGRGYILLMCNVRFRLRTKMGLVLFSSYITWRGAPPLPCPCCRKSKKSRGLYPRLYRSAKTESIYLELRVRRGRLRTNCSQKHEAYEEQPRRPATRYLHVVCTRGALPSDGKENTAVAGRPSCKLKDPQTCTTKW